MVLQSSKTLPTTRGIRIHNQKLTLQLFEPLPRKYEIKDGVFSKAVTIYFSN